MWTILEKRNMKYLFAYCLIITSVRGVGQKIAMLDTHLQQRIVLTEKDSLERIDRGYIPIEVKDLDTFYANLNYVEAVLSKPQDPKISSFELHAGSSVILVTRMDMINDDRYNISVRSNINDLSSRYILANGSDPNREVKYKVKDLKNYLATIAPLFKANYDILPKIYNVVVYPE
jgi:hypothetical protein